MVLYRIRPYLSVILILFGHFALGQDHRVIDSLTRKTQLLQQQLEAGNLRYKNELSKMSESKYATLIRQHQLEKYMFVITLIASEAIVVILLINARRRKKVNRQLELQNTEITKRNVQLSDLNREKEMLIYEIHHRVKNNLQMVSSLLNMQIHYLDDPRTIQVIVEGQNRVKAMALIHQKLYQAEQLYEIDFQEYAEQLVHHLAVAFGGQHGIRCTVNGSGLKFNVDTAIPLGLILNELITNAYKYGFTGKREGEIAIELKKGKEQYYHLRVSDSGNGLPDGFDDSKLNSLGLKLVRMLAEQLDGSLRITNDLGAGFHIRFKMSRK